MTARPRFVVLGAGLAGHSAVTTLRLAGFDGQVTLIGDEPVPPYERPPLSKAYLQGKKPEDDLFFQSREQYEEMDIDLRFGRRAAEVDVAHRRVTLDDGEPIPFNKLLIATGSTPVRLPLPGFDLPGVHYLRTLADARSLRAGIEQAERVLVIGAGFIGAEVAASARMLGREVTLVDLLEAPMAGALGPEIGAIYAEIHRQHGVDLRMGQRVSALQGGDRVEEAMLETGERIACDLVVVGVGVQPETSLFAETVLQSRMGIIVDEYCESAVPGIFAAGDVANWWHPKIGYRLRVEHYDNAADQGAAAARSMMGEAKPYEPLPYFWSDQYDVNLQYVGYPDAGDEIVMRGDPEQLAVTAFYLKDGVVRAAVTVNQPRDFRSCRRLCEAEARIEPDVLAHPGTDLRKLSRQVKAESDAE